jgi:hypothetical protein
MSGWEVYLESDEVRKVLWAGKTILRSAWQSDMEDPKSYPINTSYALGQIEERLRAGGRVVETRARIPTARTPKHLSELIPERLVRAIWKDNHAASFDQALKEAANIGRSGIPLKTSWKTFKKIVWTIEHAYLANCYGFDFLPRPKNSILHRGLDQIARAAGLEDQTTVGFAQFLDDLCPCGLKNHKEAARKMESRTPRMRRPLK